MQITNRLGMFDSAKGIMMIIIILGHALNSFYPGWNYNINNGLISAIPAFLWSILTYGIVPAFFMICGYSFRKRAIRKVISEQIKFFWKPYLLVIFATLIIVLIKKAFNGSDVMEGLRYQVLPYLLVYCPGERPFMGLYMDSIGPIWFFWVYITAGILMDVVLQITGKWNQIYLVILFAIVGLFLKDVTLPFCFQQILICCGYMYVGWSLKKEKSLENRLPLFLIIVGVLLSMISLQLEGYLEVSQNVYRSGVDFLLSYTSGMILVFGAARIGCFEGKMLNAISWIGKYALYICCIHTVLYTTIPWEQIVFWTSVSKLMLVIMEIIIQCVVSFGGTFCIVHWQQKKRIGHSV